jgi:PhzF family phenazine biosynthesis protein
LVDAFAHGPFTGNPAAVVWVDRELSEAYLQSLAMEFNQAETAFIWPRQDGRFDLRWFTPTREVPLCGHATLASAWAMWVGHRCPADGVIRFVTRESGELVCRIEEGRVVMDFPATPPVACEGPKDAAAVLGVAGPVQCVGTTAMNLTLRLADEAAVRACRPDLARLAAWHAVGVTVTAKADAEGVDFVSRFFAPAAGIAEDPVTGSAHCALAVYWANELGKTRFMARQLSHRGGELEVALRGERVELRGAAVVVMRGTIEV